MEDLISLPIVDMNINNKPTIEEINGDFLGEGAYGKVITNPRAPFYNEDVKNLFELNEVSKIFHIEKDFQKEKNFFEKNYNFLKKSIGSNYIVLPIQFGKINTENVNQYKLVYKNEKANKYNLSANCSKYKNIYQITFPKGKQIFKTTYHSIKFFTGFLNIVDCIKVLELNNIFLSDLKMSNIIDIYDYHLDNLEIKYNPNSLYKLIDYTSMFSINKNKINYTLETLFTSDDDFFECGFDYYSYPTFEILYLKYLCGFISINFNSIDNNQNYSQIQTSSPKSDHTDNTDDYDEYISTDDEYENYSNLYGVNNLPSSFNNTDLSFGQKVNLSDIFYDDLHMYLIDIVSHRDFTGYNLINKIFTPCKSKMIDFSFNIQLYNTELLSHVNFTVNNHNIFDIFEQMYVEKIGYLNSNYLLIRKEFNDKNISYQEKKHMLQERDLKIFQYTQYIKNYIKNFSLYNQKFSNIEIKQKLMRKIQNYSFGVIILNFITVFYSIREKYDEIYVKLLQIALQCCISQYYSSETKHWYLNTVNTFSDIEILYYSLIDSINN